MKLIFRGGLNKHEQDGYTKSYFYEYSDTIKKLIIQGEKVCFVTMAKPDHYYDDHIVPQFNKAVDIIGNENQDVDWSIYDLIFLCGGETISLKEGLMEKKFNFEVIKKDAVILGDSAGAMLMAPYFYETDDRKNISFVEGIFPATDTTVIVHTNNPNYCSEELVEKIEKFAQQKNLNVLKLKENETKLFDERNKKFVDFNFEKLF